MTEDLSIQLAHQSDLPAIVSLLNRVNLPTEGVREHVSDFLMLFGSENITGAKPIGCVGLEVYGEIALLRSMAMAPEHQGKGLGTMLIETIVKYAKGRNIKTLYLLTETAEDFFHRIGFRIVEREQVPEDVKESIEFTKLCVTSPSMMLRI